MAEIDINSLEPNSHKYKSEKARENNNERKRVKPVIDKSSVVSTKKPLSKKISETFISEDGDNIKTWLIMDVIIPGIKNTILDMVQMAFFGEIDSRRRGESRRRNRDDRTNYGSYYYRSSNMRRNRDDDYYRDDRLDFRNIVLRNRSDAENVIEEMRRRIRDTGAVSVADLFDLIDIPGRYTDNNYGWDDERDIGIRRVSSGFLIDVAEPRYLN